MKKRILIIAATLMAAQALSYAQAVMTDAEKAAAAAAAIIQNAPVAVEEVEKPQYWERSTEVNLGFNETNLKNWAAGGFNTLMFTSSLDAKANYKKDLTSWNNRLQLDYGFLRSSDKPGVFQKSNDRMYLESGWAYKTSKDSKWNYSAGFDFRSQFTHTPVKYLSNEDGKWYGDGIKSGFFSPAYMNLALGMEWVPKEWFNITFSPVTGGLVICTIPELRKAYGMIPFDNDPEKFHSVLFMFGAQIKANFKMTINDVFAYDTQLVLFSNYLDHPERLRVNWDNKISWQAAKFIKLAFNTWLIYDPRVIIDGTDRVQFKEAFTVNLTYTFKPRK